MGVAVQIQNVSKSFGSIDVLKDVSLSAQAGEFLTLLGPSGCGKSTLLRIIAGLEVQSVGSVSIAEQVVDGLAPKQRNVAMVFQSYALYPHMSVAGNIALPLIMARLKPSQRLPVLGRLLPGTGATRRAIQEDVAIISRSMEIEHLLKRMPGQLSGGQKQRVALARAMVRQPSVFLLDEPLSNLDASLRANMRKELSELHRRVRTTMIYVTHDQTEAMTMSDRVAVMSHGRVLQIATPLQIYADPDSMDVAKFVGSPSINILPARALERAVDVLGVTIPFLHGKPAGTELHLGIRPEAVTASAAPVPGSIPCVVTQIEHLGPEAFIHTMTGQDQAIVARVDAAGGAELVVGQNVNISFDNHRVVVFGSDGSRIRHVGI